MIMLTAATIFIRFFRISLEIEETAERILNNENKKKCTDMGNGIGACLYVERLRESQQLCKRIFCQRAEMQKSRKHRKQMSTLCNRQR